MWAVISPFHSQPNPLLYIMAPTPALRSHKRSKKTTTAKVGANVLRCGRWVLRQTKIRKARAQILSPKTPPIQVPSKVAVEKKKRSTSPVPSEQSCTGENSIPVLAMSRGVPEPNLTAMDRMIDKLTGAIFIFQIVVVIALGIAGNVWKDTEARKFSAGTVFVAALNQLLVGNSHSWRLLSAATALLAGIKELLLVFLNHLLLVCLKHLLIVFCCECFGGWSKINTTIWQLLVIPNLLLVIQNLFWQLLVASFLHATDLLAARNHLLIVFLNQVLVFFCCFGFSGCLEPAAGCVLKLLLGVF